jgi:outer membrane protein assembly factor BamB
VSALGPYSAILVLLALVPACACDSPSRFRGGARQTPPGGEPGAPAETSVVEPHCPEVWSNGSRLLAYEASRERVAPAIRWKAVIPWTGLETDPVLGGELIALLLGTKLVALDLHGEMRFEYIDWMAKTGSSLVAGPDGTFFFGTSSAVAVSSTGEPLWRFQPANGSVSEGSTISSTMVLDDEGTLYFSASDGNAYAVDAITGTERWRSPVGLHASNRPQWVGPGVGETVFIAGRPRTVAVGQEFRLSNLTDPELEPVLLIESGMVASKFVRSGTTLEMRSHVLDKCGSLRWSFPETASWGAYLVGKRDEILARSSKGQAIWYNQEGKPLVGPERVEGSPMALAFDGTLYVTDCSSADLDTSEMTVRAYDHALKELWSLPLGSPCTFRSPVLSSDGLLVYARQALQHVEVIAVDTGGPGLAPTAWPIRSGGNGRANWLPRSPDGGAP